MGNSVIGGRRRRAWFRIIPSMLIAAVFLLLGLAAGLFPEVPASARAENALVSATLLLTAGALITSVWRPYLGGWLTCGAALLFAAVLNAFHLSNLLMPARPVGYHPFFSIMAALVALLGVAAFAAGRRRTS